MLSQARAKASHGPYIPANQEEARSSLHQVPREAEPAHLQGSLNVGVSVEDLTELIGVIENFTNTDRIGFARVAIKEIAD